MLSGGAFSSEKYAVVIDGERIPMSAYKKVVEAAKRSYLREGGEEEREKSLHVEKTVLKEMIDGLLITTGAKREGIIVTEAEIGDRIKKIKKEFPSSHEFHKSLAEQGLTVTDLKKDIKKQLIIEKLIERFSKSEAVTDEEIEAFYDRNKDVFIQEERRRVIQILISGEARPETDLGAVKKEDLPEPIGEIVFSMSSLGETEEIEMENGIYIFKVEEILPAHKVELSSARHSIRKFLLQEKGYLAFQRWLADQWTISKIEVAPSLQSLIE